MPMKWLFVITALFTLFCFPLSAYSQSFEDESEYSGTANDTGSYSRSDDDSDRDYREYSYYSHHTSDNDDDYYDSDSDNRSSKYSYRERYANDDDYSYHRSSHTSNYRARLPSRIAAPGEKVIIIDPRVHAWGAYTAQGVLLRSGLATSGSSWCRDLGHPCHTKVGSFRIYSLGSSDCYSTKFPLPTGGAPMPYCMYFNGNQAIHGSYELAEANISHGCVRVHVSDAEWIRFNFATKGTKVIVKPY
jgi:hypothetical protein